MQQINVFLAHTGRSLSVNCEPSTRVEEFQRLLSELTGAPPADQILTYQGVPLASSNLFADYGLSGPSEGEETSSKDVFLYSRALLRQDAGTPSHLETLPELSKPLETSSEDRTPHPLDTAASPLLRALPEYHRQFREHLREAEAAADASAARVALCCRLVNESEVQAMAVDAAMASVEPHYAYICNAQASFQEEFSRKFSFHQDVLSSFDADVEFLCSIELPEQLQYNSISTLSDLVDLQDLRSIATDCRRSHRRFASRVTELESLHSALRTDVETLFMRAPCVDLDDLSQGLATAAAGTDEQATIVQALAADLRKAETAVEEATPATLPSASSSTTSTTASTGGTSQVVAPSTGLQDTVGMLEAMHEAHITTALTSVAAQRAAIEAFAQRCVEAKNALATDALQALRTIASQQSKIREMKEALAPFPAALERQDAQISSLLVVRRLPAAFKQALAECLRRAAFAERYSSFAADLAERMGKFRLKEEAMRNTFKGHVEGHLPTDLLHRMGLEQPPPVCTVSVPQEEVKLLLPVTPEDLRRLHLPRYGSVSSSSSVQTTTGGGVSGGSGVQVEGKLAEETPVVAASVPRATALPPSQSPAVSISSSSLQLQNAQLRSELASQIALSCVQAAELAALGPSPSASARSQGAATGGAVPSISETASGAADVSNVIPAMVSSSASSTTSPAALASTTTAAPPGMVLGLDASQKFERALAAKDALVLAVKEDAVKEAAALKERIVELEATLAKFQITETGAPPGAVGDTPKEEIQKKKQEEEK